MRQPQVCEHQVCEHQVCALRRARASAVGRLIEIIGRSMRALPGKQAGRYQRDLRLDFFRGLALIFIFIDHIPGDILSNLTFHSFAFFDAAEVFVFISGYTAAVAYGGMLNRKGARLAVAQIYHRVWQLYIAHVFVFVLFAAEASYSVLVLHTNDFSETLRIQELVEAPHVAIINALLLRFQPEFLDILPLYIVLLAGFPAILLALGRNPLLALIPSFALYAMTHVFGWHLTGYPDGYVWFFNPLAWQFLFVIGATIGSRGLVGMRLISRSGWFIAPTIAFAVLAAVIKVTWIINLHFPELPTLLQDALGAAAADKNNLGLLRLISFLALAVTTAKLVRPDSAVLRLGAARWVIACGQSSLYVFCLGLLLSVIGHFVMTRVNSGITVQMAVNLAGCALMIGLGQLLAWYKKANRMQGVPTNSTSSGQKIETVVLRADIGSSVRNRRPGRGANLTGAPSPIERTLVHRFRSS
jgi:hypothetical protein